MQIFNAGPFTVGYYKGFIRRVRYGDIEVIRAIYMALRDQNWNTFEPIIDKEEVEKLSNSFKVRYDCFHEMDGQKIFRWKVSIEGTADGKIIFEIRGESAASFLKNRAGLCILHPISKTAGSPCELDHADGTRSESTFPEIISADNPFKQLRSFRWNCNGNWYTLNYEGDVFETEDQRNWCDASYKTFCTPLDLPFPVRLNKGDKVHQKVTFRSDNPVGAIIQTREKTVDIVALERESLLTKIGIAASTEVDALSDEHISALRSLQLHHYRIEVTASDKNWIEQFKHELKTVKALDLALEVALHVSSFQEIKNFLDVVQDQKYPIIQVILFDGEGVATSQTIIDKVPAIKKVLPKALVGGGTDYNFRELNVNRFDGTNLDFIAYSIDPQEHATDDLTIIENIGAEADTVRSARHIYNGKQIHISSLTLRKRFNPAATVREDRMLSNERKSDPRQHTPFAAGFTLGSIKCLSQADVDSVTLFQSVGSQGIISLNGGKSPLYDVLKEIGFGPNVKVIHTVSSDPLAADALLISRNGLKKLIVANYTPVGQLVSFGNKQFALAPYEIKGEVLA